MPRGAAVIRYEGLRGVSWRIKYADADGRQVKETVGREAEGISRKHAEQALRDRLVKVERRGWRKPAPTTFADYAAACLERAEAIRQWKPATAVAVRKRLRHLTDTLGPPASRRDTSEGRHGADRRAPRDVLRENRQRAHSTCCTTC